MSDHILCALLRFKHGMASGAVIQKMQVPICHLFFMCERGNSGWNSSSAACHLWTRCYATMLVSRFCTEKQTNIHKARSRRPNETTNDEMTHAVLHIVESDCQLTIDNIQWAMHQHFSRHYSSHTLKRKLFTGSACIGYCGYWWLIIVNDILPPRLHSWLIICRIRVFLLVL